MLRNTLQPGLLALLSLSMLACGACRSNGAPDNSVSLPRTTLTLSGDQHDDLVLDVEVVASARGRQRGLMFRDELPDGQGMLFIFDDEQEHPFWMKNTLIPLDIVFIDSKRTVVGIVHNARPKNEESLSVGLPSRYVLELPGGYCNRMGVHRGDLVKFKL